jgi:mono/diheme cytochrome c family protein
VSLLITRGLLEQFAMVFLAGALVFGLAAAWSWRRKGPWRRTAISGGVLVALAAASLGAGYTVAPNLPTAPIWTRLAVNPVPETAENLAAGRELYQTRCSICHGPRARGDGPAAVTMNPRPFDLTVHVPLHPEGEIFYFVSEGIPGTQMPAWKEQLSDTQRWQVIRFLEAFVAGRVAVTAPR